MSRRDDPRGSRIAASNSARAMGYERCRGCGEWTRCDCAAKERERGRREGIEAAKKQREDAKREKREKEQAEAMKSLGYEKPFTWRGKR